MTNYLSNKQRQKNYLEEILKAAPQSDLWETWRQKSGELPPDFKNLPVCWELPHPLVLNGTKITSIEDWQQKRGWLKEQFQHWMLGNTPEAPQNWSVELIQTEVINDGERRIYRLYLDPQWKANIGFELLIPKQNGPHPVFMTQTNHRSWGLIALRRGYASVLYNACDLADDSESFLEYYPTADWSLITRRAWAASRVIDALETIPEIIPHKIILTGHSRNGKQTLIASAFDERIFAVISSSSGAMGVCPTRFFSEEFFGEGIELITRRFPTWFHPRLRFFIGREQYLPVDLHDLITLSAPRPCLISTAINDNVESVWAVQHAFLAAKTVYQLYQQPDHLQIEWRSGGHWMGSEVIESYLDWCDQILIGEPINQKKKLLLPIDPEYYQKWFPTFEKLVVPEDGEFDVHSSTTIKNIQIKTRNSLYQILGKPPSFAENPGESYGIEPPFIAELLFRKETPPGVKKAQRVFGELITADIYTAVNDEIHDLNLPTILWLPPFSISHGYHSGYFYGEQFYLRLAQHGFKVYCFDPIGMGSRIKEATNFYKRYPNWSLLGKMLHDISALITVAKQENPTAKILLAGFGFGALCGLQLSALDPRVDGAAFACLPSLSHGLNIPRFWFGLTNFISALPATSEFPFQTQDFITCFAPRPLLLAQSNWDNGSTLSNQIIRKNTKAVYQQFSASEQFELIEIADYNHLSPRIQEIMFRWLINRGG